MRRENEKIAIGSFLIMSVIAWYDLLIGLDVLEAIWEP